MAVITKYVVVRNGVELDKVFTVKKEAEAYDKMLSAADSLADFIRQSDLEANIDAKTIDAITILMAQNGPEVVRILKGIRPAAPDGGSTLEKVPPNAAPEKKTNFRMKKAGAGAS